MISSHAGRGGGKWCAYTRYRVERLKSKLQARIRASGAIPWRQRDRLRCSDAAFAVEVAYNLQGVAHQAGAAP